MLDSNAIEHIFGRLHVRYGAKLAAAYQGVEMRYVKDDWAELLDGISAHAIRYAITNLPLEWPPTVGQFRALCYDAPAQKLQQIDPPANPEELARGLSKLKALKIGAGDPRAWIGRLIERQDAGQKLNTAQKFCLTEALKNLGFLGKEVAANDVERTEQLKKAAARLAADYEAKRNGVSA